MARPRRYPNVRLPSSRQSYSPGLAGSIVLHALVILALVWRPGSDVDDAAAIGGPGPAGGGGGRVRYVELPPAAPPPAEETAQTPRPTYEFVLPEPKLKRRPVETPRFEIPRDIEPVIVTGMSGGSGRGGGVGSGAGSGIGSASGPGTGGGGGSIYPPQPKQLVLPPDDPPPSVNGREYAVRLSIDERGRVIDVEIEPKIEDARYRKRFRERMYQLTFFPARSVDGRPVKSRFLITITP